MSRVEEWLLLPSLRFWWPKPSCPLNLQAFYMYTSYFVRPLALRDALALCTHHPWFYEMMIMMVMIKWCSFPATSAPCLLPWFHWVFLALTVRLVSSQTVRRGHTTWVLRIEVLGWPETNSISARAPLFWHGWTRHAWHPPLRFDVTCKHRATFCPLYHTPDNCASSSPALIPGVLVQCCRPNATTVPPLTLSYSSLSVCYPRVVPFQLDWSGGAAVVPVRGVGVFKRGGQISISACEDVSGTLEDQLEKQGRESTTRGWRESRKSYRCRWWYWS